MKMLSCRSADLQSAVSPIFNRLGVDNTTASKSSSVLRVENPRYSRLQICATAVVVVLMSAACGSAAVIGTNIPASPLTRERIATLPAKQQPAWKEYLEHSARQLRADQAALQNEMAQRHLTNSLIAPPSRGTRSIPVGREAAWYAGAEARRIADIVVSFQTPAGGWSKNIDLSKHSREAGEGFTPDNSSRFVGTNDYEIAGDQRWSYVGTIDNDATTAELRFLARVISAGKSTGGYEKSFGRGVEYLLAAQNPNGGWPQVWPLQGGYHDAITYNDGAMLNVLRVFQDIAAGKNEYKFASRSLRKRASASFARGLNCILASQIVENSQRTVWCQQHDVLTLQPSSARNYEMPSLCSGESAAIASFLMELPKPDSNIVAAVRGAAAWFEKTQIRDVAIRKVGNEGRTLVAAPGSGPMWARYYEIGSDRPIFGDRDKTIHDVVGEISRERRDGYAWFTENPGEMQRRFAKWREGR